MIKLQYVCDRYNIDMFVMKWMFGVLVKGCSCKCNHVYFPTSFYSILSRASSLTFNFIFFFENMRKLKIFIWGGETGNCQQKTYGSKSWAFRKSRFYTLWCPYWNLDDLYLLQRKILLGKPIDSYWFEMSWLSCLVFICVHCFFIEIMKLYKDMFLHE